MGFRTLTDVLRTIPGVYISYLRKVEAWRGSVDGVGRQQQDPVTGRWRALV